MAPGRLGFAQVQPGCLGLQHDGEFIALGLRFGLQAAVTLQRVLEFHQALVQTGLRHWRCEVADERGGRAALGQRAFGRVVGCVEVQIGQVTDQAVRPALRGQAVLFAGHELERAVRAEVQHRMGAEVFAQPAVKSRESVSGCKAFFEQQAHRVALIAEGRLDADKDIAKALAQHKDAAAVALLAAGCGAPGGFDVLEVFLAAHMIVRSDQRMHIGLGAVALGVAGDDALAQGVHAGWQLDGVAFPLHGGQGVVERLKNTQKSGGAGVAGIRWKVEQHGSDLALGFV